jgi:hypothetical protein
MRRLTLEEVLRYTQKSEISRSTVRKYYIKWRLSLLPSVPLRCDKPECSFFSNPLEWNGKELPLILDHINGCNTDNRAKNLRLVCPNCDSQLKTRGGANKGRVQKSSGAFALVRPDGLKDYHLPVETARLKLTPNFVETCVTKAED